MKKYLFGYLFVRIAKLLAFLTILAGIVFAVFRLEQASVAAQTAAYQPSQPLQQSLARLGENLAASRQLVVAFSEQNGGTSPTFPLVELGTAPRDNPGFVQLAAVLAHVDAQRHQLKDTLVSRFEALVESIQVKLRAHAAQVAPAAPPPAVNGSVGLPTPPSPPTSAPAPPEPVETLYSGQMSNFDVEQRTVALNRGKEVLKVLETAAENPANRQTLTDSIAQLDALTGLLPAKAELPVVAVEPPPPVAGRAPAPVPRRELNAEKVAEQLGRLRGQVRQTLLTSWTLDAAYAQANETTTAESGRCRVATLSVKGIWLAAFGQLALALLASVFVAFLVLVLADFMQTLLDTATNTGIMAANANKHG